MSERPDTPRSVINDLLPHRRPKDPDLHSRVEAATHTIKVTPSDQDFSGGIYSIPDTQREKSPKLRKP